MWLFSDPFRTHLRRQARQMPVTKRPMIADDEPSMDSINVGYTGFYDIRRDRLGQLTALILAQAQSDGVSRVRLHYGNNRMFYTIDGVDYEMVPVPAPSNVDLVRALAKASGLRYDRPGRLTVRFADLEVTLNVRHGPGVDDPFLEITGFTGEAAVLAQADESGGKKAQDSEATKS